MTQEEPKGNITPLYLEEEMRKSYLSYAMSVIVGRALPDARDGLKPVQRRILFAMQGLGLFPNRPHRKAARLVGEVMGKYHPHGDTAIYDTIVRMAQSFSLRHPLVNGQGNFGSIDGDPPAAMRYTEVRLSPISEELLQDLDKETVEFIPNFDNSLKEPTILPAKFPNLLLNGSSGIAVGMATNIPPHNLRELLDACIKLIEHPESSIENLLEIVRGPDFPTGGIILGEKDLKKAYFEGRGKIILRGKAKTENLEGRERIIIEELPYQVNKARLIERIADLAQDNKIRGIKSIRDESDKSGIRVVVELSRFTSPEIVLNQLYRFTSLQETYGIIFLALVKGKPELLTLKEALKQYLDHRKEVVIRRTNFQLKKEEKRAHLLEGLKKALGQLDEVILLIRVSSRAEEARKGLIRLLQITETQAQAILDMRLQRLTGLEREKIESEYQETVKNISELRGILANEEKIWNIIKEELLYLKNKYGEERRTTIRAEGEELIFNPEDLIKKEDIVITVTSQGYIKYTPWRVYQQQHRGGKGMGGIILQKGDFAKDVLISNTHSTLLFFTLEGRVHWAKAYQLPQRKRFDRGRAIVNILALREDETISTTIAVDDFTSDGFLLMVTSRGIVKKTLIAAYSRPQKGGIIALNLSQGNRLIKVLPTSGQDSILFITRQGRAILFSETDVRSTGRVSQGVKGISLRKGDEVIDATIAGEGEALLTITSGGYGKRTLFSNYRKIHRGGKGVINMCLTPRRGEVIAGRRVQKDSEVIVITRKGKSIRLPVKEVRLTKRNTMGSRVIRLDKNDQVIALA